MTSQELKDVMNNVISILEQNKVAATPQLLSMIVQLVTAIESNQTYQKIIADAIQADSNKVMSLCSSAKQFEQIEEKLVLTNLSDQIISILTKIQNHNLVMTLIAQLV